MVKKEHEVLNISICLRRDQVLWLNKHKDEFQKNKFFRAKLDEYIKRYTAYQAIVEEKIK